MVSSPLKFVKPMIYKVHLDNKKEHKFHENQFRYRFWRTVLWVECIVDIYGLLIKLQPNIQTSKYNARMPIQYFKILNVNGSVQIWDEILQEAARVKASSIWLPV